MSKKKKERKIAIGDIAFNLGLPESKIIQSLRKTKPQITYDHRDRPCVSIDYLDALSNEEDYEESKRQSLASDRVLREQDNGSKNKYYKSERDKLLKIYRKYIVDLEVSHKNCLDRVNLHHHESHTFAAYLLLGKVISHLKMGCLTIEHGYWCGGSVIREIDETLDLAHYFVISKSSSEGKENLHKWFRQNYAPPHHVCRSAISEYMANLIDEIDQQDHKELMNGLYQSKSKWVHPTYSSIREVTEFCTDNGIQISTIEYGVTSYELKLFELAHFFRSSIWSAFQKFQLCLTADLPLTSGESDYLLSYDRIFQDWDSVQW